MNKALAAIVLIIIASFSVVGQWKLWGTRAGKKTYYQRLVRQGDLVTVWLKVNHTLSHIAVDCSNNKMRYMIVIENESLMDADETWNTPGPKYGEWVYRKACSTTSN